MLNSHWCRLNIHSIRTTFRIQHTHELVACRPPPFIWTFSTHICRTCSMCSKCNRLLRFNSLNCNSVFITYVYCSVPENRAITSNFSVLSNKYETNPIPSPPHSPPPPSSQGVCLFVWASSFNRDLNLGLPLLANIVIIIPHWPYVCVCCIFITFKMYFLKYEFLL